MIKYSWVQLIAPPLFLVLSNNILWADAVTRGEPDENLELEHVQVTATRSYQLDIDIAAAVTLVEEKTVLELAPDVIAEMLRGRIGTFFQQTTPGQGIPIIRGLKGSQILHLVDGMRLNNALFRNAPNQYLGLVDSFAATRMEVVRGSQGSLYGADAMGGVLNILTPEPVFNNTEWQQEGRLYASFDSVDNGLVLNARTQGGQQGWGFSGGASYQDHADRTAGNGEKLPYSGYESRAADVKFVVDSGERSSLMFSAQVMEQPSTPRYDELVPGFGQLEPSSTSYQFEPNRRSFLHARFQLDGQNTWFERFEAHAARQVITDDRVSQEYGSAEIVNEKNSSTLDGMTLQFNSNMNNVGALVWGAEYYVDNIDSSRFTTLSGELASNEVRSRFPDDSSMDSAAVYLSGEWLKTANFSLNAGLRYSWFDIYLPAGEFHADLRLKPSDLAGDIHLVYAVSPDLKLVSNFGRGFRPPNIFDLATLGTRPGNRFNIANTDLDPEYVWSYDLGIKKESGDLELEIFAFYLDYSDRITSVFTGDVTADGRDIVRSENQDSVQIYGLEAGFDWAVSDNLRLFSVVNYTRGEERTEGGSASPADRVPPLNGRLGLNYVFKQDWSVEPYLLFATRQDRLSPRDSRDPRINPLGTPGWGTVNVTLEWRVSTSLQLGLRSENLTDNRYREHASGIDAGGRNVGVWAAYSFP